MTLPTLEELIQHYARELPPAPCDCGEEIGGYIHCRCSCGNYDDAKEMAVWCDEKNREPIRVSTLTHLEQFAQLLTQPVNRD